MTKEEMIAEIRTRGMDRRYVDEPKFCQRCTLPCDLFDDSVEIKEECERCPAYKLANFTYVPTIDKEVIGIGVVMWD